MQWIPLNALFPSMLVLLVKREILEFFRSSLETTILKGRVSTLGLKKFWDSTYFPLLESILNIIFSVTNSNRLAQ